MIVNCILISEGSIAGGRTEGYMEPRKIGIKKATCANHTSHPPDHNQQNKNPTKYSTVKHLGNAATIALYPTPLLL